MELMNDDEKKKNIYIYIYKSLRMAILFSYKFKISGLSGKKKTLF